MDVLAAHFEGREPMRPGFSGANDKLYVHDKLVSH